MVEEEVEIELGWATLVVFAGVCPHPIAVGDSCSVELSGFVVDDAPVRVLEEPAAKFEQLDGFRYRLTGRLIKGLLDVDGVFVDVEACVDSDSLEGEWVAIQVDRLDAAFG